MGHFVKETFNRKAVVRVADGTPPLNRYTDLRGVQIDLYIGYSVKQVRRAFDRSGVNTILDAETLKHRPFEDGLADNRVRPRDRVPLLVKTGDKAVIPHRAIPAAPNVVFSRPDDFHGNLGRLSNVHCFLDKIGVRICSTSKSAAEQSRV